MIEYIERNPIYFRAFVKASNWKIDHHLHPNNFLIQFFDEDYNVIVPEEVEKISSSIIASFGSPINGYVTIIETRKNYFSWERKEWTNLSTVTLNHNLETKNLIVQLWDTNNKLMYPNEIIFNSETSITLKFSVAVSGTAMIVSSFPTTREFKDKELQWQFTHWINQPNGHIVTQIHNDSDEVIEPLDRTLSNLDPTYKSTKKVIVDFPLDLAGKVQTLAYGIRI